MYTLVRAISTREIVTQQLPALSLSVLIAEKFYKFHSFSLECMAFLATWYVIDAVIALFRGGGK